MDDKKYVRVIFQLEPDRHEFIKQEAEKRGLSISQYLRNLVREKFIVADLPLCMKNNDKND